MPKKPKNHAKTTKTGSVPPFMSWRWLYFSISGLVLIPGILSLAVFGLRPAIDFTGGALIEVRMPELDQDLTRDQAQNLAGEAFEISSVQTSGSNQYILRGKDISNDQKNQVVQSLTVELGQVEELRFETVGPTLGRELLVKTLAAVAIVAGFILLYVWYQFKELKFGLSAIFAMFHDSLILLGSFSLLGAWLGVEVDVLFVTALLTTLSFSIHDTIVVFDRIREKQADHPKADFQAVVDAAILETLGRSINNSLTIIIMLLSLAWLGGETIRWFSVALLIGAITGTYSSTFTAAPLLFEWHRFTLKK